MKLAIAEAVAGREQHACHGEAVHRASGQRQYTRYSQPAPRSANPLKHAIGVPRRVYQHHNIYIADIYPDFQGAGGYQQGVARGTESLLSRLSDALVQTAMVRKYGDLTTRVQEVPQHGG